MSEPQRVVVSDGTRAMARDPAGRRSAHSEGRDSQSEVDELTALRSRVMTLEATVERDRATKEQLKQNLDRALAQLRRYRTEHGELKLSDSGRGALEKERKARREAERRAKTAEKELAKFRQQPGGRA